MTNVVLHAQTDLSLHLVLTGDAVRLAVADGSPHGPVSRPHTPTATTGRGWTVVTALTRAAGVAVVPDDGGKVVWCEIPLAERADQPPASSGTPGWVADEVAVVVGLAPLRPAATPPVTPPGAGEGPRPAEAAQAAQAAQATEPVRPGPAGAAPRLPRRPRDAAARAPAGAGARARACSTSPAPLDAGRAGRRRGGPRALLARYTGPVTRADAGSSGPRGRGSPRSTSTTRRPPTRTASRPPGSGSPSAWTTSARRPTCWPCRRRWRRRRLTDWVLAEYAAQGAGHPPTPWTGPVD
ncbi:hypothetical protein GCM10025868_31650 [Angustibacter aerolatus]|uniref:Histidine kinase/HSP90-like ATPase domain-containing protein n=1 Tax=Angustibacter aerolatus TaxID=1162965 RepID=A0ABQ6JI63_9ACTN|nr:hypothetical protein GCM10025868_31650 [Angustibacter aerolatus]